MQPAVVGGNRLVAVYTGSEKASQFIEASTERPGGQNALEPKHRLVSALDATMILLDPIIEVAIGLMPYFVAEFSPDRPWVAVVPVGCDPRRGRPRDRLGRTKERPGRGHVAGFA